MLIILLEVLVPLAFIADTETLYVEPVFTLAVIDPLIVEVVEVVIVESPLVY